MVWILRLAKLGLLAAGVLTLGYVAVVILGAAVLLFLLLNAEDAFWSGLTG